MDDGAFQWDDVKAAKNYAKHGVTFAAARDVFKDPFAPDWVDDVHDEGEQRFATLGMVEGRLAVRCIRDERRCNSDHLGETARTLRETEIS